MKFQTKSFTCGPAAVVNALRLFDLYIPEAFVAKLAKTSSYGTSEMGLLRALKILKCKPFFINKVSTVHAKVNSGIPVVIHLDEEQHWVVVIGILGNNLIVFDSDRSKWNKQENGIRVIPVVDLKLKIFGICVNKPFTVKQKH
jgi:ABC-type bacteriocin/lantibiotic exporter with double-glycine peptidase domain